MSPGKFFIRSSYCYLALVVASGLIAVLVTASVAGATPPPAPPASLIIQSLPQPISAPDLSLERLDGHPLRLYDMRGRVVFLNFWASWCVPCRQEMPAMERLHQTFEKSGLAVVAVNFGESRSELQDFTKTLSLSFPVALDSLGDAARAMGVRGLPVSILVDRDGRILWKAMGPREWDSAASRAYFEKLLQSSGR